MNVNDIHTEIATALKKRDMVRAGTFRYLLSQVRNVAIDKYGAEAERKLTSEDITAVIRKQVKSHRESIEAYSLAGRTDLVSKEQAELDVLSSLLPPDLSDEEIGSVIDSVLSESQGMQFGQLMGCVMAKLGGRADGSRVSALVRLKTNKP
jgi:hypothetical protein